uniref:Uncharacterized protein n=2 Tax=Plectus sambesii TaxID=2011161 RepID=A0A914XEP7_9BILA
MDYSFTPYDRKYRACCGCCHVKTFTVVIVFVELIFLIIAVCSELVNTHFRNAYCVEYEKDDFEYEEARIIRENEPTNYRMIMIETMCTAKPIGVGWSTLQVIMAVLVLLGIRFSKWYLLVPHLIWQGIFLLIIAVVCAILIFGTALLIFFTEQQPLDFVISCFIFGGVCGLVGGFYAYAFACIVRCCQYIKREKEFIEAEQEMHMGTISAQYATLPYEPNKYSAPDEFIPINMKERSYIP